jgi:glycosyltransferase involved in cell wall biosynthesis
MLNHDIWQKTLFSLLLGFDFLVNILELTQINFLYITTLISFCTCILLPGFLISLILRIRKLSLWEIVGLGIAFREEFGSVVLEANGCGLPVITTAHPQIAARFLIKEELKGKTISLSKENMANMLIYSLEVKMI